MAITVNIDKNPYNDNIDLFACDMITIEPGVTILCGCNGAGKTTLMDEIARKLGYMTTAERREAALAKAINEERKANNDELDTNDTNAGETDEKNGGKPQATVLLWNAVKGREGFIENAAAAFNFEDIAYGFDMRESSEGEGTMMALGRFGRDIANATMASEKGVPFVLLIDAVDSGLDEWNMKEFRSFMGLIDKQTQKQGHDFYLVITTNSWPMTQEWKADADMEARCVLVPSIEPIDVSDYPTWRKAMLDAAKKKQKRYKKLNR